ncbi:MAG TPA: hypothetical protein VH107_06055 [Lacipirellulaceae bacterium]|jgi:hypothetical protein|nr:hypothetical protein [Lacipirellulaceae bacterium]
MIVSAGAAAAAAAAQLQALYEEEERLTNYSADDLSQGWEFKILRANTRAFRKPEVFQQVCAEEAESGWQLVEKFDDSRIRFKRPAAARSKISPTGIDPYRTTCGISQGKLLAIVLGCTFGGIAVFSAIIIAVVVVAAKH